MKSERGEREREQERGRRISKTKKKGAAREKGTRARKSR